MKREFEGKTVIITGGASGIGKAAALAFAEQGANIVIVTSTIMDKAAKLARQIEQDYGVGAVGIQCDVRVETQVEAMVASAVEHFGSVDIAFNNAGVGPDGVTIPIAPLTEFTERDWDWITDVDMKGVFLCMKYELRQMQKQRSGCIVNTASTAGIKPLGGFGAYGPAKAGMIQLTKVAAVENRDFGIRCNVVCPGPTLGTGMADRSFGKNGEKMAPPAGLPKPKFSRPEEVAEIVLTLCSDAMGNVTGNVVTADKGMDVI